MSSHHIVREKQEPALLILGLDDYNEEMLGQLLEWSPTVIVTPETADHVNAYGIKIDWLITDQPIAELQSNIKVITIDQHNYTGAALKQLTNRNYHAVNIITDDVKVADYIPYVGKIDLVIYCGEQKIYPITSGFSKWKPAGELIEVLSEYTNADFVGLKQIDSTRFRTVKDGFVAFQFDEKYLFISEQV